MLMYTEIPTEPPDVVAELDKLAGLLGINAPTLDENLERLLSSAKAGTCRWITSRDWFSTWLQEDDGEPHVLWISGLLGAGKSVLTAYITNMIRKKWGYDACQYHAFDFSDKSRRSASYLLRSFAYQIACGLSTLRIELQRIVDQFGVSFLNINAPVLWEKIFRGALFNKVIGKTLYWIIDGLDEADPEAVPLLFQCFKSLNPSVRLKILVVSRETTDITMRMAQLTQLKTIHHLSAVDTYADIRTYVEDFINSVIPKGVASRRGIIEKVMMKASGNFLWVTLATKDLEQSWYSESNIEYALSGFPGEMAPRYNRMMQKIDEHPEHMRRIATVFLVWATYSFRPVTLSELKSALITEFPDLISLEHTIKSVCSDFVQLRGQKLTLVHETARYYLINNHPENFKELNSSAANEYIARVCLEYLSSSKDRSWRQVLHMSEIERSQSSLSVLSPMPEVRDGWPFLTYAATSWAYHLSLSNASSQSLLDLVLEFFANDALTWINTLALLGDLKSLIKAAQYLRAYLKNRRKIHTEESLRSLKDDNTETLTLWTVDLIRLVGKFGSNLIQNPSSIYKLIPPFCPVGSMLGKQLVQRQSTFSVAGVSVLDWDDCHARLSVGTEGSGRKVIATSEVFAALVPGAHSLVVWNAETCEEIRRIKHGEYTTELAVNRRGDMVCTAGRDTIKVWELGTGIELGVLRKHSDDRVLAVGFGTEDDHILVGYQDHLIVCQNWRTKSIVYQFNAMLTDDVNAHNGLRVVSFSPDGLKLAVGSGNRPVDLWNLSTQSRAAQCVTKDEVINTEDAEFLQPEVIRWHPTSGSIYILYHNATLIDWNPVYDEKVEHRLGAKGMACSPCGNYLLAYEARGAVKVFGLPDYSQTPPSELRLIYHLEHPGNVRDVAFGPDGRRFYDLRDAVCSVWEPEVLVPPDRPDEDEDQSSSWSVSWDSSWAPVTQKASINTGLSPITAIACGPNDIGFCTGYDDGSLSVHNMETGAKIRSLRGHASDMAIIGLTWSSSGKWIASADDSGRILVRKVQMPTPTSPKMAVYKPSDFRITSDGVNQLLFSSNDHYLLVSTFSADRIWNLQEKRICHIREHASPRRIKWIEHPSNPQRLVSIDAGEVHIFDWCDFVDLTPGDGLRFVRTDTNGVTSKQKIPGSTIDPLDTLKASGSPLMAPIATSLEISSITEANDKNYLILETLPRDGYDRDRIKRRRIELLRTTDLSPSVTAGELVLKLCAPELTREVSKLVGSYQNRLVFFNQQHWLCTWEVGTAVESHKRHLFLPKDWVGSETLRLNALSDRGTLLCPRNGEVAIIKNGIKL
jgi:WD40 repeat protein